MKMETASYVRSWVEIIPEVLSQILNSLSFKDKLTAIPMVCKSWGKVVVGSDFWREIDIYEWSSKRRHSRDIDRMIQMLVARSGGLMASLCVYGLENDEVFTFIAENASALRTLRLRKCKISDSIVEQTIGIFSNLTFLELDYCEKISRSQNFIKTIRMNCKLLTRLCWKTGRWFQFPHVHVDRAADAIATTMPRLKHLELAYHIISTKGTLQILESCRELEFLDLRYCCAVQLDDKFFHEKFPNIKVLAPNMHEVLNI